MKRLSIIAAVAIGYVLVTAQRTSSQLTGIERKLETMANEQERQLDQALADMKQAVTAATERVIQKLEAKDIDLSDEINDVRSIQAAVAGLAADVPQPPAPPVAAPVDQPASGDGTTEG
jgi:hypothetical protein